MKSRPGSSPTLIAHPSARQIGVGMGLRPRLKVRRPRTLGSWTFEIIITLGVVIALMAVFAAGGWPHG